MGMLNSAVIFKKTFSVGCEANVLVTSKGF